MALSVDTRKFLVSRAGDMSMDPTVTIQEVEPGTNAYEYDKVAAWNMAHRLAQSNKNAKRSLARIAFRSLDGMIKDLGHPEVERKTARSEPRRELTLNERIDQWKDASDDNARAHDFLMAEIEAGSESEFYNSLFRGLARYGRMTDNQRDALLRSADIKRAGGPYVAGIDVPAGRYALIQSGSVRFYQVSKPDEGRWKGYIFLHVMASDERYPIKDRGQRLAILAKIGEDIEGASKLYGREIGRCGVCGRTLTDEHSRAAGIGPVCADNMGW